MLGGICYSTVLSFLGEYAHAMNMAEVGGTWFFICFAATSFLSRPLTGHLLDTRGGNVVVGHGVSVVQHTRARGRGTLGV